MRSRRSMAGIQVLATCLLAITTALSLAPRSAHAQFALTKAQDAHIANVMNGVKNGLQQGGKSPEVSEQAALAIQASLIASYAKGLDPAAAEKAAETLLRAYIVNPGATRHALTDKDSEYIEKVKNDAKAVVDPRLPPKYSDAVVFTAGYAAQDIRQVSSDEGTAEGANSVATAITSSFKDLPPRTDPSSPFHTDQIAVQGDTPPAQASAPPPLVVNPNLSSNKNPDGSITEWEVGQDGVLRERTRYPGGGDSGWQEPGANQQTASSGATQLETREENLNAGQNNNSGNSKNRTGSDDGKKDKDKENNNGGGNNSSGSGNSNNHSGGGHHK
jgi:hypothetical protein